MQDNNSGEDKQPKHTLKPSSYQNKPLGSLASTYTQTSQEQLHRELHYIERSRVDGVEMEALDIRVTTLKAKFNAKRRQLGLAPILNTK